MFHIRHGLVLLVILSIVVTALAQDQSDDDVLFTAMQDEMNRTLEELKLENEPKAYFLSYTVNDVLHSTVYSLLGVPGDVSSNRSRTLDVNLRVGDRQIDNTNFDTPGGFSLGFLPITDSYDELRRVMWMVTDDAYKSAVSALAAKKTAMEQQVGLEERADDFSEEDPFQYLEPSVDVGIQTDVLKELTNQISASLAGQPKLKTAITKGIAIHHWRIFLDSEGNKHRVLSKECLVRTKLSTEADDGTNLNEFASFYAEDCEELAANVNVINSEHEKLVERLLALRDAETLDSYVGPVLFEDQAAAELITQALASKFAASPTPITSTGDDLFGALGNMNIGGTPFTDKVGVRVLPRFMNVVNDPTIEEFEGTRLLGAYIVDRDGMPSRRTELITEGKVEALLTTRSPVKDFPNSTGSKRFMGSPMPGNLFVSAEESMSREELIEELLTLAKDNGLDYALVIKKISNMAESVQDEAAMMSVMQSMMSGGVSIMPAITVYKIYEDGTEVPIKPVAISEFVERNFRDILAVSDTSNAYNIPTMNISALLSGTFSGGMSGADLLFLDLWEPMISVVTPSLLVEEMTLRNAVTNKQRLPLYEHPLSEEGS